MTFWSSLSGIEKVYFVCASTGSILFMLRLLLMLLGGDHDTDSDFDHDGGFHGDADVSFRIFSVQGMTGFLMIFGLVGLALTRQSGVSEGWSIIGAFLSGSAMMVAVGLLTSFMFSLQSSGTVNIRNAIGVQGTVYLRIPTDGTGKVQVTVQDRLMTVDAVTKAEEDIDTGDRIEVTDVVSGNILVVKKI